MPFVRSKQRRSGAASLLATVLREAVEEKATALRKGRRPRVGVARSTDGRSAAEITVEPVAEELR
jgi:ABC-type taurine transport system ATPase subunit